MASIELEEEICLEPKYWIKDLCFIGLSLFVLFFSLIFITPFAFPDLNQYVSIPHLMASTGDWVRVYFEKVPDLSNAPLFYWMQAAAINVFGLNTFALKLWSGIFAVIGCLATYPLTRVYFGRRAAVICCFMMATAPIYFTYCHAIAPYMVASTLFSLTFITYFSAWLVGGVRRFILKTLFWLFLALCGLSIGLSGILLPLLILIIHYLMFKGMRLFRPMCSILGILLFCVIIGGWIYVGYQYNPNFATEYFFQFNAFGLLDTSYPYSKTFLIIPVMFLAFLPWSVFLINALRISFPSTWKDRYDAEPTFFFVTWIAVVLFELGLTVSPLAWLLTLAAPINILIARYFSLLWERKHIETTNLCYDILMYASFVGAMALLGILYFNWYNASVLSIPYIRVLAIIFLAMALIVIPVMRHRSFPAGFVALFIASLACSITLTFCYQYLSIYPDNSPALLNENNLKLSQNQIMQTPSR